MSKQNGKTPPRSTVKVDNNQGSGSGNAPEAGKTENSQSQKSAPGAAPRDAGRKAFPPSSAKPNANNSKEERKHS